MHKNWHMPVFFMCYNFGNDTQYVQDQIFLGGSGDIPQRRLSHCAAPGSRIDERARFHK